MLTHLVRSGLGDDDVVSLQTAINAAADALGMGPGLVTESGAIDANTARAVIAVVRAAVSYLGSANSPGAWFDMNSIAALSPSDPQNVTTLQVMLGRDVVGARDGFLWIAQAVQGGSPQTTVPPPSSMSSAAAALTSGAAAGAASAAGTSKKLPILWIGLGVLGAAALTTTVVLIARHRRRMPSSRPIMRAA